jgi:Glycosyl transferases group 1
MDLLWIATKPPCPPIDGGRLLQKLTLEALAARGVRVTVVAPVEPSGAARAAAEIAPFARPALVPAPPVGKLAALLAARPGGLPLAIARHRRRDVEEAVARELAAETFAAVHVEQVHALPQAAPAAARGLRIVLRAQNVESDLWRAAAARGGLGLARALAAVEVRRLAVWEARAVARVAVTAALTEIDQKRLSALVDPKRLVAMAVGAALDARSGTTVAAAAGRRLLPKIVVVPAPFPARLPAGGTPLAGAPAVVVLGSGGWLPNRDAGRWFAGTVWPTVRRALPEARLHLFGDDAEALAASGAGIDPHPAPAHSRDAFAPGSVLVVPLRIASGVRMKILEAWARGVPVVATPEAAAGLGAEPGRELLLATTAEEFAGALMRLAAEPELAARLVAAGRERLAARHRPAAVADRLLALYFSS